MLEKYEWVVPWALTLVALAIAWNCARILWRHLGRLHPAFSVPEGMWGLLYRHGKFVETLGPGRHAFWGEGWSVDWVEHRKVLLTVPGQEVLTADSVSIKVSALVTYKVVDPIKAVHETQNYQGDLHAAVQLALRDLVGGVSAEAVLEKRLDFGDEMLKRVKEAVEPVGLSVHGVAIKDVMLPAELRKAFSEVITARKEGQAALERARAESAAIRSLANAAKVMQDHPSLVNLRYLQTLEGLNGQFGGNTFVLGLPDGLLPVKKV